MAYKATHATHRNQHISHAITIKMDQRSIERLSIARWSIDAAAVAGRYDELLTRKEEVVSLSRRRTFIIVAGIMLSLFMASMEGTVIATAMPTIVTQLGGLSIYSWVFSAYMLTSTTTVPVYGKLSDLYGRRNVYAFSMLLFLLGSILCGMAQSMEQLIFFRALQGLGAGGVLPLVFIIIGDLFTSEQRARMQGLFSGVWGVSSIVGPVMGGFLVDQWSWHWVFFVNVIPGFLALFIVWWAWQDPADATHKVSVDYLGSGLLIGGVVVLLLGLSDLTNPLNWGLMAVAAVLFVLLYRVERRSADPVLPLHLFKDRLFAVATMHGIMAGWAMFGSLSYVPLFVQSVLGTSATEAGTTLTPMMLGWMFASIVGGRMLLRMNFRTVAICGMVLLTLGAFLMWQIGTDSSRLMVMVYLTMMGVGMGLSIPPFLIAVQGSVPRNTMGTATSTLQFSRNIGGTLGVSVMGAFLALRLPAALSARGLDPDAVSLASLIEPLEGASPALNGPLREAMAAVISGIFAIAFVGAALGLIASTFAPGGRITRSQEQAKPASAPAVDEVPAAADLATEI